MKTLSILFFLCIGITSVHHKKHSYFFPEYKFYYTPDSCTEETYQTINGYRYLQIRFMEGCKNVEVKCYRDFDSTLIESGLYKNDGVLESQKVISRSVSGNKSKTGKSYYYRLKRSGTWNFFDSTGSMIRSVEY